jgi:hypothetical protein
LAKSGIVRKSVTYRHITLAIGILVAVLIALTLWNASPGNTVSVEWSPAGLDFTPEVRVVVKAAINLVLR